MASGGEPRSSPKMKTPPASEETDGVFHAFTSGKVAALGWKTCGLKLRSAVPNVFFVGSARHAFPFDGERKSLARSLRALC
jgi:hypothetical protein